MPPAALQSHFARGVPPPPVPVLRPFRLPAAPPPPVLYGPKPVPLRPETHVPLTPSTGMTRKEIEKRLANGAEAELASVKEKIGAALADLANARPACVNDILARQDRLVELLQSIA